MKPIPNPVKELNGILPVNKAIGSTSFHLVSLLRKKTGIEKIGHAGTLDPFASGVMVMLIGKDYTRLSDRFLSADKVYRATIQLGMSTDTYYIDGNATSHSTLEPTLADLERALLSFQGECMQIPPMFSAKKIQGQKLYHLARKGMTIERQPVKVRLQTTLLSYAYPDIELEVACSKGTYIRTLAHDLGQMLGCGAFVSKLSRTASGAITLEECVEQASLLNPAFDLAPYLKKSLPVGCGVYRT